MAKRTQKKIKNPNRQLYEHIDERVKLIQQGLKGLYLGSDETSGELIHGLSKGIYYLKDIMSDLLFDEKTAKEILAERR